MACQGCDDTDGCLRETQVRNLIAELINSGDFGGYSSEWKFSTTTTSGPATKYLRLDNSTFASVTNLYINETNSQGTNVAAFLGSFSNGSAFGKIRVFKEHASNNYWLGTVTSVTDSGSYYTIGVTYVESNGSFAADDNLVVSFQPAGADGSSASDGADGSTVVGSTISDTTTGSSSEAEAVIYDWSANADILAANGDELHVETSFEVNSTGSKAIGVYFGDIAGTSVLAADFGAIGSTANFAPIATTGVKGRIVVKVKRISATSQRVWAEILTRGTETGQQPESVIDHYILEDTVSADVTSLEQLQFTFKQASGTNAITFKETTARHYQI